MGVPDHLPYCGIIRWNYFWNLYVFELFGIYMFSNFSNYGKYTFIMVQDTIHAMVSYDDAASILGSARVLRTPTKRSKVALLGLSAGDGGCEVAEESRSWWEEQSFSFVMDRDSRVQ